MDLLTYYSGSGPTMEVYGLQSEYESVMSLMGRCGGYLDESWYESCFCVFLRGGCGNRSLAAARAVADMLTEVLKVFGPCFSVVSREDFGASHQKMMAKIQEPLAEAIEAVFDTIEACAEAAER